MSQLLKTFQGTEWPLAGFVIFVVVFLLLVGSTLLKSQKKLYDEIEKLPFSDEQKETTT